MFSFWRKEQKLKLKTKLDQNLKTIVNFCNQWKQKSQLKQYYSQLEYNINGQWPQFTDKYQQEMTRIKKSYMKWNYSDSSIIKNCIKKSIKSESAHSLSALWCKHFQKLMFRKYFKPNHIINEQMSQLKDVHYLIMRQISIFCELLYKFLFSLYKNFYQNHYKGRNYTQQKIYQIEKEPTKGYIRNQLTTVQCFQYAYHKIITPILSVNSNKQKLSASASNIEKNFNEFLQKEFAISEKYQLVYIQTLKAIWDFHNQCGLQLKTIKATLIIQCIQKDHLAYYRSKQIQPKCKQQTATTQLLRFLFMLFCPQIQSSFKYLQMMICFECIPSKKIQQIWQDELDTFCFIWAYQKTSSQIRIILDAFNNKLQLQLYRKTSSKIYQ